MILNRKQLVIGFLTLLIGVFFYYAFRGSSVYFLSFLNHQKMSISIYGVSSLPTFVHTLSFILLTACAFKSIKSYTWVCFLWLMIGIVFELGQKWKSLFCDSIAFLPDCCIKTLVILYFTRGTYDPLDMLSIFLGAVVALALLVLTAEKGVYNAELGSV
jgi:hypothetical protein